jgi:hypothetical protein
LRALLARRKWIVWVALVILVLVAVQIGVSLLPHHHQPLARGPAAQSPKLISSGACLACPSV